MSVSGQILSKKLIDGTIAELLLSLSSDESRRRTESGSGRMQTAYNICLFYTALVQAYIINLLQSEGNPQDKPTEDNAVLKEIRGFWDIGSDLDIANEYTVFSFLHTCATSGDTAIMTEGAESAIRQTRNAYESYSSNSRVIDPFPEKCFLDLLCCLPLLRSVSFDKNDLSFTFNETSLAGRKVKCYPYVTFLNNNNEVASYYTDKFFILTSVGKGDRNGELIFKMIEYYSYNAVPTRRSVRRQVTNNELLRMICKNIGISTDWYPIDDCWCDLSFLKRLTIVSETVLTDLWNLGPHQKTKDIIKELRELYSHTDIYNIIDVEKKLELQHIDIFLYEMFINEGVFRSLRGLIYDRYEDKIGRDIFNRYMDAFVNLESITKEEKEIENQICERKIEEQISKLTGVLSPNTKQYNKRCCEIRADQRTVRILKAAGIKDTNFLPDLEDVRSIDDYYRMLCIHSVDEIAADVRKILIFIIKLYGALLEIGNNEKTLTSAHPFLIDKKQFIDYAVKIEHKYSKCDLSDLFDAFIEILKKSDRNAVIEKTIGRNSIYEGNEIEGFKRDIILKQKSQTETGKSVKMTEKTIFISFAHYDLSVVEQFVAKWKNLGFNIVIDKDKLKIGHDWRKYAREAISSKECAVVVIFMSRNSAVSDSVRFELEYAQKIAENKYKDNGNAAGRFIFPINLDDENIDSYLKEIEIMDSDDVGKVMSKRNVEYTEKNIEEMKNNCQIIRKIIPTNKVFSKYNEEEKIEKELKELLLYDEDSGYVISREKGDFELQVANFYALLKYGYGCWNEKDTIDNYFYNRGNTDARPIYPLVVSIKETKIKRDNITLLGYEIVDRNRDSSGETHYILTSRHLAADEYYCIPNYRTAGTEMAWMVEPLLINKSWLNPERKDTPLE